MFCLSPSEVLSELTWHRRVPGDAGRYGSCDPLAAEILDRARSRKYTEPVSNNRIASLASRLLLPEESPGLSSVIVEPRAWGADWSVNARLISGPPCAGSLSLPGRAARGLSEHVSPPRRGGE